MSNADRDILHAQPIRYFPRLALQLQGRPSAGQSLHFNIDPANATAPASSQRFRLRFLYSKTPGVSLVLILELLAIRALFFRKNALQESFALALHRTSNPLYFLDVDSHPNNHPASCLQEKPSASFRTALRQPGRLSEPNHLSSVPIPLLK